ncbi:MAG: Capsular polysaccharide export system protein KpsC, partial [uncultured Sulfurovum sp.]
KKRVLIIAQTAGDASLEYGLGNKFTTKQMIDEAMNENLNASIYLKIHPDVLLGKKESDILLSEIPKECIILDEDVNPISLLKNFSKVYTKTSGMGMEALILGLEVVCYGLPYYAGWGLTIDKQTCTRRTRKLSMEELFAGAYILYTRYYNPYREHESDIIDTINEIVIQKKRVSMKNRYNHHYFFGFSRWKRGFVRPFFSDVNTNIFFCKTLEEAIKKGLDSTSSIYVWGKKSFDEVEHYAQKHQLKLLRVEDGFVRSVSLGSDLTKAYSLVVDGRGIYFDPTQESDLECLLNTHVFDNALLERAKRLRQYIIDHKISKYNSSKEKKIILEKEYPAQKVVLVPGQVEDDASIIYGANGMDNLELLIQARMNSTDAYIIYKPHPDVLAGNRKGHIDISIALEYCDRVITDVGLDSVLLLCDEVHTMTSLVGFEALIRGKQVYTYGLPFYAGWGVSTDFRTIKRRKKTRSIDELVAATLILYPRYLHPKTNDLCEVEVLLEEIDKEKSRYNHNKTLRLYINIRNFFFRKVQLLIRIILGE